MPRKKPDVDPERFLQEVMSGVREATGPQMQAAKTLMRKILAEKAARAKKLAARTDVGKKAAAQQDAEKLAADAGGKFAPQRPPERLM